MIDEIEKEYNDMTDNQRGDLTLEQYRNHVRNMKGLTNRLSVQTARESRCL